jgi:hypothetical protein
LCVILANNSIAEHKEKDEHEKTEGKQIG